MKCSDLTGAHLHQVDWVERERACGMEPLDIDEARRHAEQDERDRFDEKGPAR